MWEVAGSGPTRVKWSGLQGFSKGEPAFKEEVYVYGKLSRKEREHLLDQVEESIWGLGGRWEKSVVKAIL